MRNLVKHTVYVVFFLIWATSLAAPTLPSYPIVIHHHTLLIEVAKTETERSTGLMYRKKLLPNHGMLFVFSSEEVRYFWMKNTYIPLDIAFIDGKGKIISIRSMKPLSLDLVSSKQPCRYALEVNKGYFSKVHLHSGDKIKLLLSF